MPEISVALDSPAGKVYEALSEEKEVAVLLFAQPNKERANECMTFCSGGGEVPAGSEIPG